MEPVSAGRLGDRLGTRRRWAMNLLRVIISLATGALCVGSCSPASGSKDSVSGDAVLEARGEEAVSDLTRQDTSGTGFPDARPEESRGPDGDTSPDGQVEVATDAVDAVADASDAAAADQIQSDADAAAATTSCWAMLGCIMANKLCWNMSAECLSTCAGGDAWKSDDEILAVKACVLGCVGEFYGYGDCIAYGGPCNEKMMHCISPGVGHLTCASALTCMATKCTGVAGGLKQLECQAECAKNMWPAELDKLTSYVGACTGTGGKDYGCYEHWVACYSGSGDKTCKDVATCDKACGNGACSAGCYEGVSAEGAELLLEMTSCLASSAENVFSCLLSASKCLVSPPSDSKSCADIVALLKGLYYAPVAPPTDPAGMFDPLGKTLLKGDVGQLPAVQKVLECLATKGKSSPGYGTIAEADFDACAELCGQ